MSSLLFACITPHPPLIIPNVGKGNLSAVKRTVTALQHLSQKVAHFRPERLVVLTPHGPLFQDQLVLMGESRLEGDFGKFGAPRDKVVLDIDQELNALIAEKSKAQGPNILVLDHVKAREYGFALELDHGAGVPLYYLAEAGVNIPGAHLTPGLLPYRDLYAFGKILRSAIEDSGRRTAIVVSGDLSHRLTRDAPAGYHPRAGEFDQKLVNLLRDNDFEGILTMDPQLISAAAECGLRPLVIALGALDGLDVAPEIMSYEGPFGVGYLVAAFNPQNEDMEGSVYVRLASEALDQYIREGKRIKPPEPFPKELEQRYGVFVSLKKEGQLRGCIGTFIPTQPNLADEIIENAISAGTRDPRFSPVTPAEMPGLKVSVDILSSPEKVAKEDELDPKHYGVIVQSGGRKGLLLPDIEEVDSVEHQLSIARQKAGIASGEPVEIYRFTVTRYEY